MSHDKKSYVAAKIIPGYGTLIYMAVTDNPDLGWDEYGFAKTLEILDVPNVPRNLNKKKEVPDILISSSATAAALPGTPPAPGTPSAASLAAPVSGTP